ncbi:MAG: formate dehydrogenase accessory sulfurtransferase FdhD [Crocinitomix sp.]|nr:formate dehydrogenase accessory sulfurtransferase FdhD [Crocinitomix sp.]
MKGVSKYEGILFKGGSITKVVDPLTIEHALQIDINDKAFTVVMQTPGDEIDLAMGLLFAEDVIGKKTSIKFEPHLNENGLIERLNAIIPVDQIGDGYLSARSLLSVSSCGICGKQSLEDLQIQEGSLAADINQHKWNTTELFKMQAQMNDNQLNYKATGGCHGAAAFTVEGEMLALREDIGRHNAMDKVVGSLIQSNNLAQAKIITFSGRLSYEIVSKAFRAKIPTVMAVSAPSTLAIDFAKEYGITLLAFSRNGKTTCYSNCKKNVL